MNTIKANLKAQAVELRALRITISTGMRDGKYMAREQWNQIEKKRKFRYDHVAYSMAKGKEYSQVENKVTPGNEIDMKIVEGLILEMKAILGEPKDV